MASTHNAALMVFMLAILPCFVLAKCECGYVAKDSESVNSAWIFTDLLESSFSDAKNISTDTDWRRQQFNVSASAGRGEYGKIFIPQNVDIFSPTQQSATASYSDEAAGVNLRVDSAIVAGAIPSAELDSSRSDLFYGSYRAGMKLTPVNGTCSAFFWYFNDTQEIDMEFLSREFDPSTKTYPVNLVIQSKQSLEAGFDASKTGTFKVVNLTFDPTAGFHEYRFDYVPGRVLFYADSHLLAEMNGSAVPNSSGHLILQHWSNGNPLWSGGPPSRDAVLTVSYVKAYFNTSGSDAQQKWASRCEGAKGNNDSVCVIPNVIAINASTGGSFFNESRDGPSGDTPGANGTDSNGTNEIGRLVMIWPTIVNVALLVLVLNWL